jgi:hypothetical protein
MICVFHWKEIMQLKKIIYHVFETHEYCSGTKFKAMKNPQPTSDSAGKAEIFPSEI